MHAGGGNLNPLNTALGAFDNPADRRLSHNMNNRKRLRAISDRINRLRVRQHHLFQIACVDSYNACHNFAHLVLTRNPNPSAAQELIESNGQRIGPRKLVCCDYFPLSQVDGAIITHVAGYTRRLRSVSSSKQGNLWAHLSHLLSGLRSDSIVFHPCLLNVRPHHHADDFYFCFCVSQMKQNRMLTGVAGRTHPPDNTPLATIHSIYSRLFENRWLPYTLGNVSAPTILVTLLLMCLWCSCDKQRIASNYCDDIAGLC